MNTQELKTYLGRHIFHSKHFGDIPFDIVDVSPGNRDYPLEVYTVDFKGKKQVPIRSHYAVAAIQTWLAEGKLERVKPIEGYD